jgi:hypothetical protein
MKKARARSAGEAGQKTSSSHIEPPASSAQDQQQQQRAPQAQPTAAHVPPLTWSGGLADVIVDRAALHVRARVPGCAHFTLDELTKLLATFHAEVEQLISREHHADGALMGSRCGWPADLVAEVAAAPCRRVAGGLVEASRGAIDALPDDEREMLLAALQGVLAEFPGFVREHESAGGRSLPEPKGTSS